MKTIYLFLLLLFLQMVGVSAQQFQFKNPGLPVDQRVKDLVGRMTLEEKVGQMMHTAPAIERLGIPAYNWWNECLHGVARAGIATVFPQAIGMAATFDADAIYRTATIISDEARAKYHQAVSVGNHGQYFGLTFWTPNINIFRDPRWGRGQETYGEDPYLTAELGTAFVKGLQGDDEKYLKTVATAKHYAVHSGPEYNRHTFDVRPPLRDVWDTYLPAFEKLIKTGHAYSVMCAYNRFEGEPCCGSDELLIDILRNQWGFDGYVVSDCGAINNRFYGRNIPSLVGEEMPVSVSGFNRGDRTSIALPAVQTEAMKALQATGKPVIFVMLTGSTLADVLFGDYNPSGQLPVTFYASDNDLPPYEDYSMEGRIYRYFEGGAFYPFGHGLSYTEFTYSDIQLPAKAKTGEGVKVSVTITN